MVIDNSFETIGPLLTELGQSVIREIGYVPDRAYLFSFCEGNWAQTALYVEDGNVVKSPRVESLIPKIAMEIWNANNSKRDKELRWLYFDYDIQDGKFNAHFVFPEDIAPGTDEDVWEAEAVKKRFGDKPIVQTGWPEIRETPGR